MTALEWLEARADGVPQALRSRLVEALEENGAGGESVADEFLRAAERVLGRALDFTEMTRAHALDVLAADALATYAFESGAEPGTLVDCTERGFSRIAALGGPGA